LAPNGSRRGRRSYRMRVEPWFVRRSGPRPRTGGPRVASRYGRSRPGTPRHPSATGPPPTRA